MLALATCIQLLELNVLSKSIANSADSQQLPAASKIFEWVVQKCFTGSQEVADLCFIALAKIYTVYDKEPGSSRGSFPDDVFFNPVLAVTLLNIGSTRLNIHETSIGLLRLLNRRYLSSGDSACPKTTRNSVNFSSSQKLNESKEVRERLKSRVKFGQSYFKT